MTKAPPDREPAKCVNPSCTNREGEGTFRGELCAPCARLLDDSGEGFLGVLETIAREDVEGLRRAYESYGPSWKSRGGVGAFMMLARKWDRLENRLRKLRAAWDIFYGIAFDDRGEGVIDDVRDLRRYLMLVEAEVRARGFARVSRDNLRPLAVVPPEKRYCPVCKRGIGFWDAQDESPCATDGACASPTGA